MTAMNSLSLGASHSLRIGFIGAGRLGQALANRHVYCCF